jgi:hypothetical protein
MSKRQAKSEKGEGKHLVNSPSRSSDHLALLSCSRIASL